MKKIMICLSGMLTFLLPLKSQTVAPCSCNSVIMGLEEPSLSGSQYLESKRGIGSTYFYHDFLRGDVRLTDGEIAHNYFLKYNGLTDQLVIFREDSGWYFTPDKYFVSSFTINNYPGMDTLIFRKIRVKVDFVLDSSEIYGQELYSGKLSLYAWRRVIPAGNELQMTDEGVYSLSKYVSSPVYYFIVQGKPSIGFKNLKKRQVAKLFPDKAVEIKKLFREKHQRRIRNEADLAAMTKILDTVF